MYVEMPCDAETATAMIRSHVEAEREAIIQMVLEMAIEATRKGEAMPIDRGRFHCWFAQADRCHEIIKMIRERG